MKQQVHGIRTGDLWVHVKCFTHLTTSQVLTLYYKLSRGMVHSFNKVVHSICALAEVLTLI